MKSSGRKVVAQLKRDAEDRTGETAKAAGNRVRFDDKFFVRSPEKARRVTAVCRWMKRTLHSGI